MSTEKYGPVGQVFLPVTGCVKSSEHEKRFSISDFILFIFVEAICPVAWTIFSSDDK